MDFNVCRPICRGDTMKMFSCLKMGAWERLSRSQYQIACQPDRSGIRGCIIRHRMQHLYGECKSCRTTGLSFSTLNYQRPNIYICLLLKTQARGSHDAEDEKGILHSCRGGKGGGGRCWASGSVNCIPTPIDLG